jgi:hypothetical protein
VELNRSTARRTSVRYRRIGWATPLRRSAALRSSRPEVEHPGPCESQMLRALLSLVLSFRVRTNLTAASQGQQRALLGFGPLQRLQLRKPGSLGFASPDTFRLQGFSPSCRFTSSAAFQPCFVLVTLLGFSFRAFSLRRSLRLLSKPVPFVTLTGDPMNSKLPCGSLDRKPRLQGLALREGSPPDGTG